MMVNPVIIIGLAKSFIYVVVFYICSPSYLANEYILMKIKCLISSDLSNSFSAEVLIQRKLFVYFFVEAT